MKNTVFCGRGLLLFLAVTLLQPAATRAGDEMLKNPGFDTPGAAWGKWGCGDYHDWARESGAGGAALWGWVQDGAGGFFQSVPCEAGREYTFTVRMKKELLFSAAMVFVRLEFYTEDDTTKAGRDQGMVNIADQLTTQWKTFTVTGMAPVGARFIRPVIGFEGAATGDLGKGQQACLIDNASLVRNP